MRSLNLSGLVLTTLLIALPSPGLALSLITNRATLGESDRVDWSSLATTPPLTFLPNSFSATSETGLGLTVEIPPATQPGITPPLIFQTSPAFPTNFANGDFILFTGLTPGLFPSPGNPGPLAITFDKPVSAAGAQIAVDDITQFTAFISAFDSTNNLLGTFSAEGTSSLALDNSALFLGVDSDSANIARLVFSSSVSERALGINALSLKTPTVPEPNSVVAIAFVGLLTFAGRRAQSSRS